ncbi:MAG: pyruvate:ferredoxin (flavodoxin) oxidoreductase [Oscillospiraceae bacterium]|jgi:pyruvate-ferredoxin/flavodoxin oxidoreductase|nr:pyruvate:ferredoxin (flavodoxin) oxidoreductase [Oscillospiraceae bacterium]
MQSDIINSNKLIVTDAASIVAKVAYAFIDVAFVYPITPATKISEKIDRLAYERKKNLFGEVVKIYEAQSEAGTAGMLHGALVYGALTATFTCSQGLLLMIPEIYRMVAEFLPVVIHVASRAIAKHALSIFCDHSDIYSCRQTGISIICSSNVQEAADFAMLSHLCAISSKSAFLHFFDGFLTSHEIQKIRSLEYENFKENLDLEALNKFRKSSINPERTVIRGSHQNSDVFFECCEAGNSHYEKISSEIVNYMQKINNKFNTNYQPFVYYGNANAERVIVAMGSICNVIEEVIDHLLQNSNNEKIGLIKVCVYRPFLSEYLEEVLPKSVEKISVLDRTKEPGSFGEPLFTDVAACINELRPGKIKVCGGRFGLGSRNTTPSDILAVFENMKSYNPKKRFTIGIIDDVTNLSLKPVALNKTKINEEFSVLIYGTGSDGSISSAESISEIIGENTNLYVQCLSNYGSSKMGGLTVSGLRFSNSKIKSSYFVEKSDFFICNNFYYIKNYDLTKFLNKNSIFLLNFPFPKEEIFERIPNYIFDFFIKNKISFYIINAKKIANEHNLGTYINVIMQTAFFRINKIFSEEKVLNLIKDSIERKYFSKGENIIESNFDIIEIAIPILINLEECFILNDNPMSSPPKTFKNKKISDFLNVYDGTIPNGTSKFKKNFIKNKVSRWIPKNCIQCNICSFVCPHAVIRPTALTQSEIKNAPKEIEYARMLGSRDLLFTLNIASDFCTGCELCVKSCPGKMGEKALVMNSDIGDSNLELFNYINSSGDKSEVFNNFERTTIKGSQFRSPLIEFSCACPGCGETIYAKLATQLFGERMLIANATGCSSIWGGAFDQVPYCCSKGKFENKIVKKYSPAWQNSLFEDAAEFGFGMLAAEKNIRLKLLKYVNNLFENTDDEHLKKACIKYKETFNSSRDNFAATENLISKLNCYQNSELVNLITSEKEYLSKKSIWVFGGDGWAYDIGFGGLDHVLASGENINVLVFDTEIYSNTGGQVSKATPQRAKAKFSLNGKKIPKKKLAKIMMTYENIYVAQVSFGANYSQCIRTFDEAENYNGPSLIIAYSPCIGHGIKGGMSNAMLASKLAVIYGHFQLFRYDPRLEKPFINDSPIQIKNRNEFEQTECRFIRRLHEN